eukprot:3941961-Rhodomonas_salina.11
MARIGPRPSDLTESICFGSDLAIWGYLGEFGSYFPEWAPRFASMQQTLDRLAERIAKLLKAAVNSLPACASLIPGSTITHLDTK